MKKLKISTKIKTATGILSRLDDLESNIAVVWALERISTVLQEEAMELRIKMNEYENK